MVAAVKACKCSSCGDEIKVGQPITIAERIDKPGKDLLCFRCHPDSEPQKSKIGERINDRRRNSRVAQRPTAAMY